MQTVQEFVEAARANGWKRKQVRDALWQAGEPLWTRRDEVLAALGFATTDQVAAQQQAEAEARSLAEKAAREAAEQARKAALAAAPAKSGPTAKHDCRCELCDAAIAAGQPAQLTKLGSHWYALCGQCFPHVDRRDLRQLLESMAYANLGEGRELDHEDWYLLEEVFGEFDYFNPPQFGGGCLAPVWVQKEATA
jgi:hypothetical protein